ncbi:MAG: hypothetical protein ACOH10_06540 [Rhodoglobus sp.]
MPSYRVTMAIGALTAGVAPDSVLPAAKAAALELVVVEAVDLHVVSGQARIVVRFTADDDDIAAQVAQHVASVTGTLAGVESWHATVRNGARWNSLSTAPNNDRDSPTG